MAAHTEHSTYGVLDHDYVARLRATTAEHDAPFLMLNLMRYRDRAVYPAGHPDAGAGRTGREADDLYAPLAVLHDLGAEVVLFGDAAESVHWDRVAVVRYPSVRSFLDMQERPDFIERHVHKEAGMLSTIIAVCRPVGGSVAGERRVGVELLGPGEPPEPGPGRLVLEVDGVPVGDGRTWTSAVIGAVAPSSTSSAATVVVDTLIQELP